MTKSVLEQIVSYLNHHKGKLPPAVETPLRSNVMREVCSDPWDAEYIDGVAGAGNDVAALYALMRGMLLLAIDTPFRLVCAKIASLIKDKSIDEARDILSAK